MNPIQRNPGTKREKGQLFVRMASLATPGLVQTSVNEHSEYAGSTFENAPASPAAPSVGLKSPDRANSSTPRDGTVITEPSSGGWLSSLTDPVKKAATLFVLMTPVLLFGYRIPSLTLTLKTESPPVEPESKSVEKQESQEEASDDGADPTEEERKEYEKFTKQIAEADFTIHENPFYSPDAKNIKEQVQKPCSICLEDFEEPKNVFGTVFKWFQNKVSEQVLNDSVSETPFLKTPVKLNSCSHVVCYGCVQNLIGHGSLSCPMCQTPNQTYSEVNEDYTVKCPFKSIKSSDKILYYP